MPYILNGTKDLLTYWNTLGRPCEQRALSQAIGATKLPFTGSGRDKVSYTVQYGEVQAQNLAAALGVAVSDVTTNGGQIQI